MIRRLLVATVGATLLSLLVPTGASAEFHCDGPNRKVVNLGGQAYIDIRYVGQPYAEMVWIYQEFNGIEGLQRGGPNFLLNTYSDQCVDPAPRPDLLLV